MHVPTCIIKNQSMFQNGVIDLLVITRDSSGETRQFRDLALTLVADTVYARPYAYYKKPIYVPKWSISFGIICHTLVDFKLFHECAALSNIY